MSREVRWDRMLPDQVDPPPTTLGLCGLPTPDWMEGQDFSFLRLGDSVESTPLPDSAYLQSVVPAGHPDSVDKTSRGVFTNGGWKYVCFEGSDWLGGAVSPKLAYETSR